MGLVLGLILLKKALIYHWNYSKRLKVGFRILHSRVLDRLPEVLLENLTMVEGLLGLLEAYVGIKRVEDILFKYSQVLMINFGRKNNG